MRKFKLFTYQRRASQHKGSQCKTKGSISETQNSLMPLLLYSSKTFFLSNSTNQAKSFTIPKSMKSTHSFDPKFRSRNPHSLKKNGTPKWLLRVLKQRRFWFCRWVSGCYVCNLGTYFFPQLSRLSQPTTTMFILRVHSVDTNHPLSLEDADFTAVTTSKTTAAANSDPKTTPKPKFSERRGIAHLFRKIRQSSLPCPASRSPILFVVAVPNYLSFDDFIRFCGSRIDHVLELVFIRNDGMEDRYSVLIECKNRDTAGEFYSTFNGRKYSPGEAELCHILFLQSVDYTESEEVAGIPENEFTELPTCPVCLERLDADTSGIVSTLCDHSFQCPCISKWTLSCQVCRLCQQQDEKPACCVCGIPVNPWICIICGFVGCGRYTEGHAVKHWKDTQHCYSLELDRQQIWDYVGDAYVHRLNQSKVDGKITNATDSRCMSLECSADSGISEALCSSKVDTIVDEYNRLVASQLENQRQYYESLFMEAKSKKESTISEAVEKAVNSKMQDLQAKLEKCLEERNAVADINRNLIKDQETWRRKLKEIDEREAASLRLREEKIVDLEEQIRDLTVYIRAQKTLDDMTGSDSIKGGTVLPVPSKQSSPANSRRQTKSGRRRN